MGLFNKEEEIRGETKEDLEQNEIDKRAEFKGEMVCPYCEGKISNELPNVPYVMYLDKTIISIISCPHCMKVLGSSYNW